MTNEKKRIVKNSYVSDRHHNHFSQDASNPSTVTNSQKERLDENLAAAALDLKNNVFDLP